MTVLTEKPVALLGEVEWKQTIQVRDYEPAQATVRLQFMFDPDEPESAIVGIRDCMFKAKTTVFEQFGKTFEIKDGVAVELVQDAFPGSQVIETHVPEVGSGDGSSDVAPPTPPHDPKALAKPRSQMNDIEKAMAKANQAWAEARFRTHPQEFYDNTESKNAPNGNPNWPDFKHKTTNVGFYVK